MADMLLTFYCAAPDREMIADALRAEIHTPLHLRDERVVGRDFSDARAAEQVRGTLHRTAIDLVVSADAVDALVAAVEAVRRSHPVRWQTVAVAAQGRIA